MAAFQTEQFKKYDMEEYQKYDTEFCNLHIGRCLMQLFVVLKASSPVVA
jgi:hypothetical protein